MAPIFTKATNIKGAGAFDKQIALLQVSPRFVLLIDVFRTVSKNQE